MQDYKMVVRTVWGGQSVKGQDGSVVVQNFEEAQEYLNAVYLAAGYELHEVHFLGEIPVNELEQSNSPRGLRFAWHLVKDVKVRAAGDK